MPSFRYTAVNQAGEIARGVLEAPDEAAAIRELQRQGNLPLHAEPVGGGGPLRGLLSRSFLEPRRGLSRQELAAATRELSVMLGAGQDLDRALRFLVETAPGARARRILGSVRDAVRDGSALSAALAEHPGSFSRLYVGLVRAGEAGGRLAPTLDRLAGLLERQRALAASITSAMVYPAILLIAALGSVALLLTQVLPQFLPLFQQGGAALPASTRALIGAGDLVSAYGLHALLGLALLFLALSQALRRPGIRLRADRMLLRLPVLGTLAREVLAARLTRTLGSLLQNRVPLIAALGITREALGNRAAAEAVERAAQGARGGGGLAEALEGSGVFPARTIHLLRLGQETAQLAEMALRAAEIHEEAVRLGLQRLVALLVPAITIAMGALVAGIVASLLAAMLSLNDLAR